MFGHISKRLFRDRKESREREKERNGVLILSWNVIFRKFGLNIRDIFVKNRRAGEVYKRFLAGIVIIFVEISGYYFNEDKMNKSALFAL